VLVRNAIIMPVLMQLHIAILHDFNMKVFFQFPSLLGQGFEMSSFIRLEEFIATLISSLKWKVIMILQKLKNSFIKVIYTGEDPITKRSKYARINDLYHSLNPSLVPWLTTTGGEYCHAIMIAKIKKIPVDICFVVIGLVNSGFKIIRNQNFWDSSIVID
jgi:hypothetical protein